MVDGRKRKHEHRLIDLRLEPRRRRAEVIGEALHRKAQWREETGSGPLKIFEQRNGSRYSGAQAGREQGDRSAKVAHGFAAKDLLPFAWQQRAAGRVGHRRRRRSKSLGGTFLELKAREARIKAAAGI